MVAKRFTRGLKPVAGGPRPTRASSAMPVNYNGPNGGVATQHYPTPAPTVEVIVSDQAFVMLIVVAFVVGSSVQDDGCRFERSVRSRRAPFLLGRALWFSVCTAFTTRRPLACATEKRARRIQAGLRSNQRLRSTKGSPRRNWRRQRPVARALERRHGRALRLSGLLWFVQAPRARTS